MTLRGDIENALVSVESADGADGLVAAFRLDPALPVFLGHFPHRALMPGVFGIEMVRYAVERHAGRRYEIARIDNVKFSGEVVPGDTVVVNAVVSHRGEAADVRATLQVDELSKATVSMVLKPASETPEAQGGAREVNDG